MRALGPITVLCLIVASPVAADDAQRTYEELNRGTFCQGHEDAWLRAVKRARVSHVDYRGCPGDRLSHFIGNPYDRGCKAGAKDAKILIRIVGEAI